MNISEYSQQDSRWAKKILGLGLTTIGAEGCAITDIGAIAGVDPAETNDRLLKVGGFSGSKVIWAKIKEAFPWLEHEWRGYTWDEARVRDTINKYGFCMVEVDYKAETAERETHWVVWLPNDMMLDPLPGKKVHINKYMVRTGYSVIKPVGNQPTEQAEPFRWLKSFFNEKGIDITLPEGDVREKLGNLFEKVEKYDEKSKRLEKCERDLAESEGTSAKWEINYTTAMKQNDELKEEISTLRGLNVTQQTQIGKLEERIQSLEDQLNPDKIVIITKDEYVRLTAARDISKFTLTELLSEALGRLIKK